MKLSHIKQIYVLVISFLIQSFFFIPETFAGDICSLQDALDEKGILYTLIDLNQGILVPTPKNPYIPEDQEDARLWATVLRPKKSNAEKLPTILIASGYTRFASAIAAFILPYGYNVVILDLRGTGSSGGEWDALGPVEQYDVKYVVDDWIPSQEWSDGNVGMLGFSYLAIIGILTSGIIDRDPVTEEPLHLKAIVPISFFSDAYRECAFQGGNMNIELLSTWVAGTSSLAAILPPFLYLGDNLFAPTKADIKEACKIWATHIKQIPKDLNWLANMEYQNNTEFWKTKSPNLYWPIKPDGGWGLKEGENVIPKKLPVLTATGWFDLFTLGTLNYYQYGLSRHENTDKAIIVGEWSHGDACMGAGLPAMETMALYMRWFDWKIKGKDDSFMTDFPVLLRVMGENRWRAEKSWPLPASRLEKRTLYLSKQAADVIEGDFFTENEKNQCYSLVDELTVDDFIGENPVMKHWITPLALHGPYSRSAQRWLYGGMMNLSHMFKLELGINTDNWVDWEDERNDEWKIPTFTTAPLEEDLEIVGPVLLKFWAKTEYTCNAFNHASHIVSEFIETLLCYKSNLMIQEMDKQDVQWIVELNDVLPDGRARNISSGWLSAARRPRIDTEDDVVTEHAINPDYIPFDPFYLGPTEISDPIRDGDLYEYAIEIWPTCNVFKQGHRIRISLSGSDVPHLLPVLSPSENTIVIDDDHVASLVFTTTNPDDEGLTWKWIGPSGYTFDRTFNCYLMQHKDGEDWDDDSGTDDDVVPDPVTPGDVEGNISVDPSSDNTPEEVLSSASSGNDDSSVSDDASENGNGESAGSLSPAAAEPSQEESEESTSNLSSGTETVSSKSTGCFISTGLNEFN